MNKAVIIVALVAVVLGVVGANKLHRRPQHEQEHEHEHEHEGFDHEGHGLEHPRLGHHGGHFDDEHEQEHEHRHAGFGHQHRGHGHGHGHEFGGEHEGHLEHEGALRHQLRKPVHKALKGGKGSLKRSGLRGAAGAGIGAAGVAGAAGAFREHENHRAGLEKSTRIGDRKSISGKKGFVAGEKKGIEGDFHHHSDREDAGIHKHQVLNRNKVFIKDQTTGINKVDGFRHSSEDSDSGHIAAGDAKFVGAGASGKISSDKEFDRHVKAGISGEESSEGAGIIGGAAIGGAGIGGAGEI